RTTPSFSATRPETALQLARTVSTTLSDNKHPDLLIVELPALLRAVLNKNTCRQRLQQIHTRFSLPSFQEVALESSLDLVTDDRARTIARIVDNVLSWSTDKKLAE
ncbi:hypothetical protein C8T65DRAFT_548800, partial [Cerioporus squamosus]